MSPEGNVFFSLLITIGLFYSSFRRIKACPGSQQAPQSTPQASIDCYLPFPALQFPLLCSTTNHRKLSGTHRRAQHGSLLDHLNLSVLALTGSSPPARSGTTHPLEIRLWLATHTIPLHTSSLLLQVFKKENLGVFRNTCINARRGGGQMD